MKLFVASTLSKYCASSQSLHICHDLLCLTQDLTCCLKLNQINVISYYGFDLSSFLYFLDVSHVTAHLKTG